MLLSIALLSLFLASASAAAGGDTCLSFTSIALLNRQAGIDCLETCGNTYIDDEEGSNLFNTTWPGLSVGDTYHLRVGDSFCYKMHYQGDYPDFEIDDVYVCDLIRGLEHGGITICPGKCPTARRLRADQVMEKATPVEKNDAMYQEYAETCTAFDYTVSLSVDDHIVAYAVPKDEEAIAAGCPHVATHGLFENNKYGKAQMLLWENKQDQVAAAEHFLHEDSSIHIGTFPGSQLLQAHHDVADKMKTRSNKVYDAISNNCAGMMLDFASALNVNVDTHITTFVAKRLLQSSGEQLVSRIRESVNFSSLFQGNRQLRAASAATDSDEQIIQLLVDQNVANHQ